MVQKVLIALLIGFSGFIIWFIGLLFLFSTDWLGFFWTCLVVAGMWIFTRKIFKNLDLKAKED